MDIGDFVTFKRSNFLGNPGDVFKVVKKTFETMEILPLLRYGRLCCDIEATLEKADEKLRLLTEEELNDIRNKLKGEKDGKSYF